MNAITSIEPSARAQVLILNARDDYGMRNPVSEGAVALAEFMAEHQDEERTSGFVMFIGGWGNVTRMLADAMMPCDAWGQEMGRLTDGAVTAEHWRRPTDLSLERAAEAEPAISGMAASAIIVDEMAERPLNWMRCDVVGLPGETEAGPLYAAMIDPLVPGRFVVTGFGQATVYDTARANAMRAALADGLKQIGVNG